MRWMGLDLASEGFVKAVTAVKQALSVVQPTDLFGFDPCEERLPLTVRKSCNNCTGNNLATSTRCLVCGWVLRSRPQYENMTGGLVWAYVFFQLDFSIDCEEYDGRARERKDKGARYGRGGGDDARLGRRSFSSGVDEGKDDASKQLAKQNKGKGEKAVSSAPPSSSLTSQILKIYPQIYPYLPRSRLGSDLWKQQVSIIVLQMVIRTMIQSVVPCLYGLQYAKSPNSAASTWHASMQAPDMVFLPFSATSSPTSSWHCPTTGAFACLASSSGQNSSSFAPRWVSSSV